MWESLAFPLFVRIFTYKIKVMLYEFSNLNKHGNIRTRVISWPKDKAFGVNPKGFGNFIAVKVFKYKYTQKINPPSLATIGGKKYLLPTWQEVLPETELSDIKWIKPKVKRAEVFEHKFESSSNDKVYTTKEHVSVDGIRRYTCNCPGTWRAKDRRCKHIKSIEK